MAVTREQVRAYLDREEPDYERAAQLGPEALPHLLRMVREDNPGLAAKATYLAGFIDADQSAEVVETAARSHSTVVRVAAAGALGNMRPIARSVIADLLNDDHVGVRKLTLKALAVLRPAGFKTRVRTVADGDSNPVVRQLASQIADQLP